MGAFAHFATKKTQPVHVFADGRSFGLDYDRALNTPYAIKRFSGLKPIRRRLKARALARRVHAMPAPIFADSWKSIEHLPDTLSVPVIVYAHGNEYPRVDDNGGYAKQARITKALKKATTLIAVSHETKSRATPFLPKGLKVDIIHPPVEPAHAVSVSDTDYAEGVWPNPNLTRCLVLCRLIDWKGVDMAIRAVASRDDCQLVIAGIGDDKDRLNDLVAEHIAHDRIVFAGRVEAGRKSALFKSADIFLQPGRKVGDQCEGFGITYVEAALHGLPSISGDQGGAPEAVIEGETAFVVDATKLENVTEALEKLVTNTDMRSRMSINAKAHADKLLWPRQIDRILAVAGI